MNPRPSKIAYTLVAGIAIPLLFVFAVAHDSSNNTVSGNQVNDVKLTPHVASRLATGYVKLTPEKPKATAQTPAPEKPQVNTAVSTPNIATSSSASSQQVAQSTQAIAPANQANTQQTQTSTVQSTDTSGFNFLGHHFPVQPLSIGAREHVPATEFVYQWTTDPRWYVIEQGGSAGQFSQAVGIGTAITINNHTYHVTDVQR